MSHTVPKPSQWLSQIKVDNCPDWTVLKFDRTLQHRQQDLIGKRDRCVLSPCESDELEAIQELAAIFAHINGQLAYQHRHCLR